jgi:hypothetical protein
VQPIAEDDHPAEHLDAVIMLVAVVLDDLVQVNLVVGARSRCPRVLNVLHDVRLGRPDGRSAIRVRVRVARRVEVARSKNFQKVEEVKATQTNAALVRRRVHVRVSVKEEAGRACKVSEPLGRKTYPPYVCKVLWFARGVAVCAEKNRKEVQHSIAPEGAHRKCNHAREEVLVQSKVRMRICNSGTAQNP